MEKLETFGLIILIILFLYWVYIDIKSPPYYHIKTKKSLTNEQIEFILKEMISDYTHKELSSWDINKKLIVQIERSNKSDWVKFFAKGLDIDLVYIGRKKMLERIKNTLTRTNIYGAFIFSAWLSVSTIHLRYTAAFFILICIGAFIMMAIYQYPSVKTDSSLVDTLNSKHNFNFICLSDTYTDGSYSLRFINGDLEIHNGTDIRIDKYIEKSTDFPEENISDIAEFLRGEKID